MKRISIAAAVIAGSALFATAAFADPVGGTTPVAHPSQDINIGLTIDDECTIGTHDIDFGHTGLIPNDITTDTTIDIECTKGTDYAIGITNGANYSAGTRHLKHGTDDLVTYGLYSTSDFLTAWGNTAGTTVTGTGVDHAIQVPVYAKIDGHQNAPIGVYGDTVTATIWYGTEATGH